MGRAGGGSFLFRPFLGGIVLEVEEPPLVIDLLVIDYMTAPTVIFRGTKMGPQILEPPICLLQTALFLLF